MDNLVIAYALIFVVLAGYAFNVRQRLQVAQRERAMLESKDE